MEPHRKGEATEATVIAEMKQRGIPVSVPFGDNERYDIVIGTPDGRQLRVQIKTANYTDGVLTISGKSQHTNSEGHQYKRYSADIDYFLGYNDTLETMYWIPEEMVGTKIYLRVDEPEQVHGTIHWAEDYAFDEAWPPEPGDRVGYQTVAKNVLARLEALEVPAWFSTSDVPYTLIVEGEDGQLLRLCVRSISLNDGRLQLNATTGPERKRIDYFAAYSYELDRVYLVGSAEFEKSIKLRVRDAVQHRSTINWAEEYELEARRTDVFGHD